MQPYGNKERSKDSSSQIDSIISKICKKERKKKKVYLQDSIGNVGNDDF